METTGIVDVIWGIYRGYIGIMEKNMETTIVYWLEFGLEECSVGVKGDGRQGVVLEAKAVDTCSKGWGT